MIWSGAHRYLHFSLHTSNESLWEIRTWGNGTVGLGNRCYLFL